MKSKTFFGKLNEIELRNFVKMYEWKFSCRAWKNICVNLYEQQKSTDNNFIFKATKYGEPHNFYLICLPQEII
jgi:hypothetical protein